MKIGIVGATGYGGAELVRILTHHPHAEECILYSSSGEGKVYSNVYPHLTGLAEQKLKPINMNTIKQEIDVMFLLAPREYQVN